MMSNGESTDDMFNIVLNLGLLILPAVVLYNVKYVIDRILSNGQKCEDDCECDLDCSDCSDCSDDSTDSDETIKPKVTQTYENENDSGSESDDESENESDGINDIINKLKTDDDDIFMTELNEHIDNILKDLD